MGKHSVGSQCTESTISDGHCSLGDGPALRTATTKPPVDGAGREDFP
ncbi:hypothetical protein VDBG_04670 [Verticillium alfalfae VaMs.102]|uniref:Uncharacterized protein n=1 Tax=Verticillium alfalfae (strain VaMs.102 / ATCC MYA-4576 / FGSC 10136) TaxID=526221 RepID=C9SHY8_VERA1|nr:hypothetical protein VDBG_04670 [Verticillium alfalfae VaMs.102]EEY18561.1 hypothetical protein VDBG_04670 [Verticillium alfalfae VaMs.102]